MAIGSSSRWGALACSPLLEELTLLCLGCAVATACVNLALSVKNCVWDLHAALSTPLLHG